MCAWMWQVGGGVDLRLEPCDFESLASRNTCSSSHQAEETEADAIGSEDTKRQRSEDCADQHQRDQHVTSFQPVRPIDRDTNRCAEAFNLLTHRPQTSLTSIDRYVSGKLAPTIGVRDSPSALVRACATGFDQRTVPVQDSERLERGYRSISRQPVS